MCAWENLKKWTGMSRERTEPELYKSQYSLVNTGEVTADTLKIWMELPDEVKYDPALAQFRQMYEKEHGKAKNEKVKNSNRTKRLPLVKSMPAISLNLRIFRDDASNGQPGKVTPSPGLEATNIVDAANEPEPEPDQNSRVDCAKYYVKMTLLLACWVFFTAIFLIYNEKEVTIYNSSVAPGEIRSYFLQIPDNGLKVLVDMTGPFMSENKETQLNVTDAKNLYRMEVWLERWMLKNGTINTNNEKDIVFREKTNVWSIIMENTDFNFVKGEHRSHKFHLVSNKSTSNNGNDSVYAIRMLTIADERTPFTFSYTINPVDISIGVIYAGVLLMGLYVLIIFEVINHTMAAITVSTMSLAALAMFGERPAVMEVISWLDVETLLLLFCMMLLVAITAETGIFDYISVLTFQVTKGKLWPLIYLLGLFTAVASIFLDNVTTVLLISPVTIRLCEVMELDPIPILIFIAMFSNVGGAATPVGVPNVIVASNKVAIESGINFTNFTIHMLVGVIFIALQTCLQLKFMFRDSNKLRLSVPREILDVSHQISIWRRAVDSLPHVSSDVDVVRERLERKIKKLKSQLVTMIKESNKRACPKDTFQDTLADLKSKYKIRDKVLLIKSSVALFFVVLLFFLHAIPELNRVSLAWTALLGAILLLILADRTDLEPILHRIEWTTLLFFAALFVLMEALSKLGLIIYIGGIMESLIMLVDESARLSVAIMVVLWVSGILAPFVTNIPLTTMMIRVVINIGANPHLNLPLSPLIWALLYGACLGGNGTLIGSSANVVCAGIAEQHGYKISFGRFFRLGFPIMIGHLIIASIYLLICHCVFEWH